MELGFAQNVTIRILPVAEFVIPRRVINRDRQCRRRRRINGGQSVVNLAVLILFGKNDNNIDDRVGPTNPKQPNLVLVTMKRRVKNYYGRNRHRVGYCPKIKNYGNNFTPRRALVLGWTPKIMNVPKSWCCGINASKRKRRNSNRNRNQELSQSTAIQKIPSKYHRAAAQHVVTMSTK